MAQRFGVALRVPLSSLMRGRSISRKITVHKVAERHAGRHRREVAPGRQLPDRVRPDRLKSAPQPVVRIFEVSAAQAGASSRRGCRVNLPADDRQVVSLRHLHHRIRPSSSRSSQLLQRARRAGPTRDRHGDPVRRPAGRDGCELRPDARARPRHAGDAGMGRRTRLDGPRRHPDHRRARHDRRARRDVRRGARPRADRQVRPRPARAARATARAPTPAPRSSPACSACATTSRPAPTGWSAATPRWPRAPTPRGRRRARAERRARPTTRAPSSPSSPACRPRPACATPPSPAPSSGSACPTSGAAPTTRRSVRRTAASTAPASSGAP